MAIHGPSSRSTALNFHVAASVIRTGVVAASVRADVHELSVGKAITCMAVRSAFFHMAALWRSITAMALSAVD